MKKKLCIILFALLLTANVGQAQFLDSEPMFGQMLNLGHWSTDGLVFYWRGIEAGNVVDESFYRNHGMITGPTWVGNGLSLNGTSDFVSIPDASELNFGSANWSFIIWFKSTQFHASGAGGMIEVADAPGDFWPTISLRGNANGTVRLLARDDDLDGSIDATSTGTYDDGLWHSATVVRSGTSVNCYFDGIVETIGGSDAQLSNMSMGSSWFIGKTYDSTPAWWGGDVSDINIYNRALSASEILDLYINRDLPMQQEPIWLMYSPPVGGIDIGALMRAIRSDKTGGKQGKSGGKQ
ncbi:MAG TPA: LamG domain-containing protein [Porticoccus sp.]|nr:LamG domain-containing protein [Porticoccus sp.]